MLVKPFALPVQLAGLHAVRVKCAPEHGDLPCAQFDAIRRLGDNFNVYDVRKKVCHCVL